MADPRIRLERMLGLLPLIYTAQPRTSAVGDLLQVMAGGLARLDDDLKRVLYDRWVGLASGAQAIDGGPSALESLGHLVEVRRLPAPERVEVTNEGAVVLGFATNDRLEQAQALIAAAFPDLKQETDNALHLTLRAPDASQAGDPLLQRLGVVLQPEPPEAYRQRLLITTRVLTRGLATPRAILSLALASLGTEPCPRMERHRDATVAWGVRASTRRTCTMCNNKAPGDCPNRESRLVDAWLTENPPHEEHHQESELRLRRIFTVRNVSLLSDRPVVRIKTSNNQPAVNPAIQNRNSGEVTLYTGTLRPGDVLTLMSGITPDEAAPFDSHDGSGHHPWRLQTPQGRALLVTAADGVERDVSGSVFYLWGDRFDDAASVLGGVDGESGMRFGVLQQAVRTPSLRPGDNEWMLFTFAQPESAFDEDTAQFAGDDDKDGTRFALLDRDVGTSGGKFAATLLSFTRTAVGAGEVDDPTDRLPRFDLDLEWVARAPATFRLRVPRNGWVIDASRRGAIDLLRTEVEQARAAGVRALIDFPEPVQRERHDTSEGLRSRVSARWSESATVGETGPQIRVGASYQERHGAEEGRFALLARFDQSRLDWGRAG